MNLSFKGKTVVVSGAGLGFGRAIAESFANLGARVFGCDILEKELAATGKAGVTTKRVDLTDRAAAASWIKRVEKETGGAVDILVNNAGGVAGQGPKPARGGRGRRLGQDHRGQSRRGLRLVARRRAGE